MKVYVGNQYKEGSQLYLYYYNETEDTIEYISNNNKVIDGYVEFEINHCSEYFLTGAIINVDSSVSKTLNYVIGVLFLIVFILVAVTLFGN
jgi:surface polysaccharide O-acyltransferase-like enzyme